MRAAGFSEAELDFADILDRRSAAEEGRTERGGEAA
jgi:hypothetical protein